MKLYLMRHAQSESGEQLDPTRTLTDTGKAQAKMMAKWLARQDESPGVIVQSNMKRSQDTAKRLVKKLDAPLVTAYQIDPDGSPESAWRVLKQIGAEHGGKDVIAVSHGPLVEKLLAYLIGSPVSSRLHFAHAAIAKFDTVPPIKEAESDGPFAYLHWLVTPNTVARDEGEMEIVTEAALVIADELLVESEPWQASA